jgi:hypothetical protein
MTHMMENKLDKLLVNKYQNTIDQAIQQRLKTTDIAKPIARFQQTVQQAAEIQDT